MELTTKYEEYYMVHFKDKKAFKDKKISLEGGQALMTQLNTKDFVMIDGTFLNKYEVRAIELIKKKRDYYNDDVSFGEDFEGDFTPPVI